MKKVLLLSIMLLVFLLVGCKESSQINEELPIDDNTSITVTYYVDGNEWKNQVYDIGEEIEFPELINDFICIEWSIHETYAPEYDISIYGESYTYFGKYPQSHVSDKNLIAKLNSVSTTNENGYYVYDGKEYACVFADLYSGFVNNTWKEKATFSDGTIIENGEKYWFNVEPIKWRIIYNDDGTYLLFSKYILDSQKFYRDLNNRPNRSIKHNDYEYSDIRAWINDTFYNAAFNNDDKNRVLTSKVDNSASTTEIDLNPYYCSNTNDKVFLLSYQDVGNEEYHFYFRQKTDNSTRTAEVTDYAIAKGAFYAVYSAENRNGNYWLRSPDFEYTFKTIYVNSNGYAGYKYDVDKLGIGVRPAIRVDFKENN